MAKNDVVLIDGIIDQQLPHLGAVLGRPEAFEIFAFEQILKNYDLSRDEIESGWTDGRNDGGIDGFYVCINGHLLCDRDEFVWPKSNASIEVWLITCKHHDTFVQATLDSMLPTLSELFDLSVQTNRLHGSYSEDIRNARELFILAYRKLSISRPELKFHIVYASRGDTSIIGESVLARAMQIENPMITLFSSCDADVKFVGAAELVGSHRITKTFSLELPFVEHLATGMDSYVLLVRIEDYWRFVSDENKNLRRYLFDSNVRDYLGKNQVNEDIASSLADDSAPDFWWLNNGVTILATSATVPGKTIQLKNIQIVNGLQTTESIFSHFQKGDLTSRDRCLLVKIIVSSEEAVRDRIIRATNNQSPVEISALHATDKVQRDIEEILQRSDWYYERRKNYYQNIGKPQIRFVTPIFLASAVVALIYKSPQKATRLKSKFMRDPVSYDAVFSERLPIKLWPILVDVFKRVEFGLSTQEESWKNAGERFSAAWRTLVSLILVSKQLGTFAYSNEQLCGLDPKIIEQGQIDEIWLVLKSVGSAPKLERPPTESFEIRCCKQAAMMFGILGAEDVGKRSLPSSHSEVRLGRIPLSEEFVEMVDMLLPKQPWKPGVQAEIASKLDCPKPRVALAIEQLIASGKRNVQKDGVVFDRNGLVVAIDPDRYSKEI